MSGILGQRADKDVRTAVRITDHPFPLCIICKFLSLTLESI